jgi:thiol-disulfide isomerase/thioredoxin
VTHRTARLSATCLAALAVLAAATACGSSHSSKVSAEQPGTCLTASAMPSGSGAATPSSGSAGASKSAGRVPAQSLACLDGSGDVRLDTLSRPAVINLWASWCEPCRAELPAVEAFAKAAAPAIDVIGIDTADERSPAQSTISDFGLTYAMVSDPDQHVLHSIGAQGLPATLFVAPGGDIRHVYNSGTALDTAHLNELAATYLGVTVHR